MADQREGVMRASSPDGRQFTFVSAGGLHPLSGDFLTIAVEGESGPVDGPHLGQVLSARATDDGTAHGRGLLLGVHRAGTVDASAAQSFSSAPAALADEAAVSALFGAPRPTLPVGALLASPGIEAPLLAGKFNRHTFWCGQSGSGKTYALGVLLEQLLIRTSLPIVVFDPNGDFVNLDKGGSNDNDQSRALAERDIRVLRPSLNSDDALRVRFVALPMHAKAAVLRLDPVRDRDEYNELMHLEFTVGSEDSDALAPHLRDRGTPTATALATRIENLRLMDWSVWAYDKPAATEIIDQRPDATVLDIGGFENADEPLVVAMAVLDDLWAKREQRRPVLIVIDEAHNLCSPEATTPLQIAVRDRLIQIAAEGRKFGLWLLLSTQRPSKVHPNIISQCDNLALMRMSSPLDLAELAEEFGFAPPELVARSAQFRQGEVLFAGGFIAAPTLVQVGDRLTPEGGADVAVPLR